METTEVLRATAAAMRDESRVVLNPANIFETTDGVMTLDGSGVCRACVFGHLKLVLAPRTWGNELFETAVRLTDQIADDFTQERITAAQSADALDALADSLVTA